MSSLVKRASQWVRRRREVRWIGERLGRRAYRIGRPGGRADRALAQILTFFPPGPDLSQRTVPSLVELFFELSRLAGVQRFVEAGAKDAGASVRASSQLGLSDVTAFEANPYTYRRFVDTVTAAGVDYLHLALGEASGSVTFLVRLGEDGGPLADGQGSLLVRPDHLPGYEEVTVPSTSLDEHFAGEASLPTAMWIDVEGASASVLRGATAMLASVKVVVIEVESERKWEGQEWIDHDVVGFFLGLGLKPVARDRQSRQQYNIVFARPGIDGLDDAVRRWRDAGC